METKTKVISGLIAIIFAVIGVAHFTPEYVGRDLCTDKGIWVNVTEIVYHNETFPAIARYWCASETDMHPLDCLALNKLNNTKGCKWGGRLSSSKRTLYEINDPPLLIDSKVKAVSINQEKLLKKYPNLIMTNDDLITISVQEKDYIKPSLELKREFVKLNVKDYSEYLTKKQLEQPVKELIK